MIAQQVVHLEEVCWNDWFAFLAGLPEMWERNKIQGIAETIGGGTPSTKVSEYWVNGDIMWFIPKDLTNNDCLILLD